MFLILSNKSKWDSYCVLQFCLSLNNLINESWLILLVNVLYKFLLNRIYNKKTEMKNILIIRNVFHNIRILPTFLNEGLFISSLVVLFLFKVGERKGFYILKSLNCLHCTVIFPRDNFWTSSMGHETWYYLEYWWGTPWYVSL